MPEHNEMSQEIEIANLSNEIKHLTTGFEELKSTLERRDVEIHDHINRKFTDEMKIGLLELEKKLTFEIDSKVSKSIDALKTLIKTWAVLLMIGVSGTVGVTAYFSGMQSQPGSTRVQELGELYKIISQENRKNVKQTEVIIKPERGTP